jgi:hypothetical protein
MHVGIFCRFQQLLDLYQNAYDFASAEDLPLCLGPITSGHRIVHIRRHNSKNSSQNVYYNQISL